MKTLAWVLTGSVGLASDAAESIVNVIAAVTLLAAIRVSRTPPDYQHPYGHEKVEDLSSAFEAGLILLASALITVTALARLITPQPLDRLGVGLIVSGGSAVANGALAWFLFHWAGRLDSQALRANARHIRTDVWTSVGVLAGIGLVAVSGVQRLDPLVALIVAVQIAREGFLVLAGATSRLLDERLPEHEERRVLEVLGAEPRIRGFHRLRSRRSGRARFLEVDVFVDPTSTVADAHLLVEGLEDRLQRRLPNLVTTVHVEPFVPGRRDGQVEPRDEYPRDEPT